MLKRMARKGQKRILIAWNRGLGDIALGLYAMVYRIRTFIPDASITFLTRENLQDGFQLLDSIQVIPVPWWKRGQTVSVLDTLEKLGIDVKQFDRILENPDPTSWVSWQIGTLVPKLKWNPDWDALSQSFGLEDGVTYIGVQAVAETQHGPWRNWPLDRWHQLFQKIGQQEKVKILLFGHGNQPVFAEKNIIDLRGKTSLFELLSIIKNRCRFLLVPDSGILSIIYYLNVDFPLQIVSLWADPRQGVLKQKVPSPNPSLMHQPLLGQLRDLTPVTVDIVYNQLFPVRPLQQCVKSSEVVRKPVTHVGCILLAGGQGTRLNHTGPKGLFPVQGKSLFQWICEKPLQKNLPLAVMTSPQNHQETVAFFETHAFFGLEEVHFFQQEMRPLLDEEKKPIEIRPGELLQGPNGNGSVFRSFVQAGLASLFEKKGIDTITVIPVDNPLADPFDEALITYHREHHCEVTLKCVERREGEFSVGVLGQRGEQIEILEYTEMPLEELKAYTEEGKLKYPFANSGQFALKLSFLQQMAAIDLPLHWVRKKVQVGTQSLWVWKGEQFIFDAFPYAKRVKALCASRDLCYAPLKSLESLDLVQRALQRKDG